MANQKVNKKGTWPQALVTFFVPILMVLTLRWAIFEPFVIPSASMVPNLLIHDHILVLKSSMGLRVPFSNTWLVRWTEPKRGDVLVFKYPENPNVYYIKRLIGLPGDKVEVTDGRISVNGQEWTIQPSAASAEEDPSYSYFIENSGGETHRIRFFGELSSENKRVFEIPEDHYFFMGDNRDESSDGRVWGYVPGKYLVGHAWRIWLSCEQTLVSAPYLCDFSTLRPGRMLRKAQ
jgi:signal peptidase I